MHLINQTRYKIVIADDPNYTGDSEVLLDPEDSQGSESFTEQEIRDATKYLKYYYKRQMDALQGSDADTDSEEEDGWTPRSSPIPTSFEMNDDFENDPIDDDEYKDLMSVLDDIVRSNPAFLHKPRPVIDVDIYKYISFVAGTDDLILDLEYYVQEYPDDSESTG
ncbi:uncharacterized protein LOC124543421 isoform X2 [Vanessa cardui]|uniref:uncharacterized protein LOC124543421 isoform X2 n=1 Tax=Vanessa cardui TaxID=171605 RepID=UPI001F148E24|nr:uncharacterized protein LOC124543421 isoform X2 [Vanessa cardui]XP_046977600.1 uncharacterized protein LOC124543421 isoform X2 [Vanessa cardui]